MRVLGGAHLAERGVRDREVRVELRVLPPQVAVAGERLHPDRQVADGRRPSRELEAHVDQDGALLLERPQRLAARTRARPAPPPPTRTRRRRCASRVRRARAPSRTSSRPSAGARSVCGSPASRPLAASRTRARSSVDVAIGPTCATVPPKTSPRLLMRPHVGLIPKTPHKRRRDADRSSAVAAHPERNEPGRHRDRRSPSRILRRRDRSRAGCAASCASG